MKRYLFYCFVLVCYVIIPQITFASNDPQPKGTIIIDLHADEAAIYSFDRNNMNAVCPAATLSSTTTGTTLPKAIDSINQLNINVDTISNGKNYPINADAEKITLVHAADNKLLDILLSNDNKKILEKCSSNRFYVTKDDNIKIYIITDKAEKLNKTNLSIIEKERDSQFVQDLHSLVGMVVAGDCTKANKQGYAVIALSYTAQYERAYLTAQLNGTAGDGGGKTDSTKAGSPATAQAPANSNDNNLKKELVTGPMEHWFLSADVRFNSVNQMKYDSTSQSLQSKDTPNAFYLSFNYMLGDVYADKNPWYDYFVVKTLVEASERPYNAFGLGIGWRKPDIKFLGLSFNSLSPFISFVWTRGDSLNNGTVNTDTGYGKPAFIWGLSFNLDTAAKWFSKSDNAKNNSAVNNKTSSNLQ